MAIDKELLPTGNSTPSNSHVEVITENGFGILRIADLGISCADSASECHFVVGGPIGFVRKVIVEFSEPAIALVQRHRRTSISLSSSFWLDCAERHLADYLWEKDAYPPTGRLKVDSLAAEELLMAARWD